MGGIAVWDRRRPLSFICSFFDPSSLISIYTRIILYGIIYTNGMAISEEG